MGRLLNLPSESRRTEPISSSVSTISVLTLLPSIIKYLDPALNLLPAISALSFSNALISILANVTSD